MSYTQYTDMFEKCQDTAPYHMFVYDMIDSRKQCSPERQSNILQLLIGTYKRIQQIEKEENRQILHQSEQLIRPKIGSYQKEGKTYYQLLIDKIVNRADCMEPFFLVGDLVGFTIQRRALTEERVDAIWEECKKTFSIPYTFHKANGFYETDDWNLADKLYFRGYCIQELEKRSKQKEKLEVDKER
ncbi:MAG: hypothetical protein ACLU84_05135 [Clostridia bacterium]